MWIGDHFFLEVSPGFLLMLAAAFWMDRSIGLMPWVLLACAIHEIGHLSAAAMVGGTPEKLRLTAIGAELTFSYKCLLSYWKEVAVMLAGPAANGMLGILLYMCDLLLPAVLSLGIGIFNLLPVIPLDGGCVLHRALGHWMDSLWVCRIMTVFTGIVTGVLLGVGVIAAVTSANLTLLITAAWLVTKIIRNNV